MSKKPTKKSDIKTDDTPSAPPVFDVSKPGATAATPSSRPIITSHKSMIKQDPMVSSSSETQDEDDKVPIKIQREANIEPVSENTKKADDNSSQPAENTKEKDSQDSNSSHQASDTYTSEAIDALADEAAAKKKDQKEKDEEVKKKAEIEKLIETKKYYLPIHDGVYARRGAGTLFVNLLLALLVIAALIVLAQDAGYIDVGLELPFDLLK